MEINKPNWLNPETLKYILVECKWYFLLYIVMILSFSIFQLFIYKNHASIPRETISLIILTIVGILCILYHNGNKKKIHRIAFVTIILFGIITLVLSPVLIGCDEDEHLARADLTSEGILVPHYQHIGKHKGYYVEQVCVDLDGKNRFKTIYSTAIDDQKINKKHVLVEAAFAQNPFYAYLPQGFGIWLAKELNLNSIWVLWLGGIFNLLMYATVSSYAIKKTPILKMPMLAVACLPFAVYEATTVSSDSFVLCFSLLLMAYFFTMYKAEERSINKGDLLIFFILCLSVGLIKPPLLFLASLVAIIPKKNFNSLSDYKIGLIGVLLVFAIGAIWNVSYSMPGMKNSHRGPRAISMDINTGYQLKFMFSSIESFTLIMWDIISKTWFVIADMFRFADWQGKYAVYSSTIMAVVFAIYYGLTSFLYPIKYKISKKQRIVAAIIFLVPYIALFLVQYLTWTPVGSLRIQGVQGRYFIPLLILLPFILNINSENTRYGERIRKKLTLTRLNKINLLSYVIIIGLLSCLQILTVVLYY